MAEIIRFKKKPNLADQVSVIKAQAAMLADLKQKFLQMKGEVGRLRARYETSSRNNADKLRTEGAARVRPIQPASCQPQSFPPPRRRKHRST